MTRLFTYNLALLVILWCILTQHPLFPIPVNTHFFSMMMSPGLAEICDNGIDDDGDGFVDLFDQDCPCSQEAYQAYCPLQCETIPDSFPNVALKLKWRSNIICNRDHVYPNIVVGDINGDGLTEIVSKKSFITGANTLTNGVVAFKGMDGTNAFEVNSSPRNVTAENYFVSIADVDHDGLAEFFYSRQDTIVCVNNNGTLKWKSDPLNEDGGYCVNLADFNADGIPEVYKGNNIVNALTGKLLVNGNAGGGCNMYTNSACDISNTVAADLRPANGLELAAGNTVYEVVINNTSGTIGNSMTAFNADSPVRDGLTSVGDIDGDGELDIVVVRNEQFNDNGGVWVWNPRTLDMMARAGAGTTGGIAFIGNVAGDCNPEIGVNFSDELFMFSYDGSTTLKVLYRLVTTDGSGYTGVTMFDFNQDGKNELVYRDETYLRVLAGSTGTTLSAYPIRNGTGMEYPVVADVDGDDEAEILVSGYTTNSDEQRLFCFESNSIPWAPARSVWNQPGYHVTNVNDDLTIPRVPQNQAKALIGYQNCLLPTCPAPYNAFMAQATFRTQEGCVQFPEVDLSIAIESVNCLLDSAEICFVLENKGDKPLDHENVAVTGWTKNPFHIGALPVVTKPFVITLVPGEKDTLCFFLNNSLGSDSLFMVINDSGTDTAPISLPNSSLTECRYFNNLDSIYLNVNFTVLELGPDVLLCPGEEYIIDAGNFFNTYLWQDGSSDPIYTVTTAGLYFVEATNSCGLKQRDTVQVDLVQQITTTIDTMLCQGETLSVSDTILMTAGDYMLTSSNCDSLFLVHLIFNSPDTIHLDQLICTEDSIFFNNTWIDQAGIYTLTTFNRFGCDSTVIFNLTTTDQFSYNDTITICEGDSIQLFGVWEHTNGLYSKIIPGVICDTLFQTQLFVQPVYEDQIMLLLCPGDSVYLDAHWIYVPEIVTELLQTSTGCDSTVITAIDFIPAPDLPQIQLDCENAVINASITLDPQWSATWSNGQTGIMTSYYQSGTGNIFLAHEQGCNINYSFTLPSIPDINALTLWTDTTILENHTLPINLPLNPDQWTIQWSPAEIFSCETCLKTTLSPIAQTIITADLTHSSGCTYRLSFTILIEKLVDLYIPNVFSPNADQINDGWTIISPDFKIDLLEVEIFDRWGELINEWKDTQVFQWDGTFHGKKLNPGVFTYKVTYKDQEGKRKIKTGNITLLR